MNLSMFDTTSLLIFTAASITLAVIPGPAVLFIIARSLEQGRIAGLVSTLGIGLAGIVHVILAALGLSALVLKSALMFNIIKYIGAVYLIYLGIKTLFSKQAVIKDISVEPMKLREMFWQGFIVNLFNPKTAIFFLAFLPQFVNPASGSVTAQFLVLGMIFVLLALTSDSLYALVAGSVKQLLTETRRVALIQKYFSSTVYIGLGIATGLFSVNKSE